MSWRAEPPLPGVAPEAVQSAVPVPDLFAMLGQLTALTRETQLQGRATNRLHAELSAKLDHLAENQISADTMARRLGDIRREARLEVITEVLEVRDRFSRGVEEAQRRLAGLHGFWARFAQREVLTALVEGICWRASAWMTCYGVSTYAKFRAWGNRLTLP